MAVLLCLEVKVSGPMSMGIWMKIRHVETILEGVAKYRESDDGRVPWRERPEHFRKNCVARIPPIED